MKKIIIALIAVSTLAVSCKEDKSNSSIEEQKKTDKFKNTSNTIKVSDEIVLSGEFIYTKEAAVLQGNNFIYGVKLDSMASKLAAQVKSYQREDYDMVPVVVKAKVQDNPNAEGWDKIIEIKNIIKVSEPISEPAIKVKGE